MVSLLKPIVDIGVPDELSQGGGHRGGHRDGHRDDDGGTQDSELDGETTTGSHSQHADDLVCVFLLLFFLPVPSKTPLIYLDQCLRVVSRFLSADQQSHI